MVNVKHWLSNQKRPQGIVLCGQDFIRSRQKFYYSCVVFLLVLVKAESFSVPDNIKAPAPLSSATDISPPSIYGNRHVCLMDDYECVRGPHFNALLDELFQQTGFSRKRVAYITTSAPEEDDLETKLNQLQSDLDLEACQVIQLAPTTSSTTIPSRNICDPKQLREAIESLNPSILWLGPHENSYVLRHALRIHNVDSIVNELCGPPPARTSNNKACMVVGEGAGALCAGANMAVAALRNDNPRECPELQWRGLQVLGPRRSVSFVKPLPGFDDEKPFEIIQEALDEARTTLARAPLYDPDRDRTKFLNAKQVYIYSQVSHDTTVETTSLVMNPYQKGAIEQLQTSKLKPLPPLSAVAIGGSSVARECTGEPSEDPSRTVHLLDLEDDNEDEDDSW